MPLAQIGPLTAALETCATAVGAGVVLGGFAAGVFGLVARRDRRELERKTIDAGYLGGLAGVLFALADLATNFIV